MEDAEYEEDGWRLFTYRRSEWRTGIQTSWNYYCGYGTEPFPNEDNNIQFSNFDDLE